MCIRDRIYSWLYYIVLIVGILLSGIFAIRRTNEQQKMLVLRIALFGIIDVYKRQI